MSCNSAKQISMRAAVHSAERARHGYWLHQTRLDNPLFGNEPESRNGYTKYQTFLPTGLSSRVSCSRDGIIALVSLPTQGCDP